MLTNKFRTPLALRALLAAAAACLLAGATPGESSAMPLGAAAVGSITIGLTHHPAQVSGTTRAEFAWRTTGIVGETRCKLDGAPYTYCRGNPSIYGGLADGRHTFTVRVRNGYQVTAKATYSWLIDTAAPTEPDVAGGSATWRNAVSAAVNAGGATDALSGLAGYEWRVSTDGSPWSTPTAGATATVRAQGLSYVQFRSIDRAGNVSGWAPSGHPVDGMVRLDRTPPTAPTVIGGSLSWQDIASVSIDGAASTDARSGVDHYEYRESVDGGPWSAAQPGDADVVTREGETLVQFRAVDTAGNAGTWTPATPGPQNTARIDRSGPSDPVVAGGSAAWRSAASVTLTASGSVDTGFGVDHYQYRTSVDGGATWSTATAGTAVSITAPGTTLVQFRSIDVSGLRSQWAPSSPTTGSTVAIDRTAPTAPAVTGGSLSWQDVASVTISASGGTDAGGSALATAQARTSTNGGNTWSAPVTAASIDITAEGQTLVQFRNVDNAGNSSAWAPASTAASATVRIDRTAPTAPAVTGGSLTCTSGTRTLSGSGASDAGGSGVAHYEYRISADAGSTYGTAQPGASVQIGAPGTYVVQFRAVDAVGLAGAWGPGSPGAANTACIS